MVSLIRNAKGKAIGWKMNPTTKEEAVIAETIRDLTFFGTGDNEIIYDGLSLIEPDKGKVTGNLKELRWLKRKHSS